MCLTLQAHFFLFVCVGEQYCSRGESTFMQQESDKNKTKLISITNRVSNKKGFWFISMVQTLLLTTCDSMPKVMIIKTLRSTRGGE